MTWETVEIKLKRIKTEEGKKIKITKFKGVSYKQPKTESSI